MSRRSSQSEGGSVHFVARLVLHFADTLTWLRLIQLPGRGVLVISTVPIQDGFPSVLPDSATSRAEPPPLPRFLLMHTHTFYGRPPFLDLGSHITPVLS